MKTLVGIGVILILLFSIVLSLPFLIDLNRYQDLYKPLIEKSLNRKISFQDIRLMVWPHIGARVSGFTVTDDETFSEGHFASLDSLDIRVRLRPLMSGELEIEEITLRSPKITIVKNKTGELNLSTLGRYRQKTSESQPQIPVPASGNPLEILARLAVDVVSIEGGMLTYLDLSVATPTEYVLDELECVLTSIRLGESPHLHIATVIQPLHLPVILDGTFGPLKETMTVDMLTFQAEVGKVAFGLTGNYADRDGAFNISVPVLNTGDLPFSLPLKKPIEAKDLQITTEIHDQELHVKQLSFKVFDGKVEAEGTITAGGENHPYNGTATIQGLQLGPALDAAVALPVSIRGMAGMQMTFKGQGPSMTDLAGNFEGSGDLSVKEGSVEGITLPSLVGQILKLAGIWNENRKAVDFSSVQSYFLISHDGLDLGNLVINSDKFRATGTGTIGLDQALKLRTSLSLSENLSQMLITKWPTIRRAAVDGQLLLHLNISGSTRNPSIDLDQKDVQLIENIVQETVTETVGEAISNLIKKILP